MVVIISLITSQRYFVFCPARERRMRMSRKRNLRNENQTRNKNGNKKIKKKNKKTGMVNTMEGWPPKTGSGSAVTNRHASDNGAKLIFKDPVLCAEFLRGYTDIPLLKDVQPEDIEDVSERFLPMFQEGRDSDAVKKVRLKGLKRDGMEMYLIAIVEHQSKIDYSISFRLLRYVVMVLTDYESELERLYPGITKTKDF